jgi:hypothetical protein
VIAAMAAQPKRVDPLFALVDWVTTPFATMITLVD